MRSFESLARCVGDLAYDEHARHLAFELSLARSKIASNANQNFRVGWVILAKKLTCRQV